MVQAISFCPMCGRKLQKGKIMTDNRLEKKEKANVYRESDLDRYMARHRKSSNEEIKGKAALKEV